MEQRSINIFYASYFVLIFEVITLSATAIDKNSGALSMSCNVLPLQVH